MLMAGAHGVAVHDGKEWQVIFTRLIGNKRLLSQRENRLSAIPDLKTHCKNALNRLLH